MFLLLVTSLDVLLPVAGAIFGPFVGGLLANPRTKYPALVADYPILDQVWGLCLPLGALGRLDRMRVNKQEMPRTEASPTRTRARP